MGHTKRHTCRNTSGEIVEYEERNQSIINVYALKIMVSLVFDIRASVSPLGRRLAAINVVWTPGQEIGHVSLQPPTVQMIIMRTGKWAINEMRPTL